jgi:hypothetical protein
MVERVIADGKAFSAPAFIRLEITCGTDAGRGLMLLSRLFDNPHSGLAEVLAWFFSLILRWTVGRLLFALSALVRFSDMHTVSHRALPWLAPVSAGNVYDEKNCFLRGNVSRHQHPAPCHCEPTRISETSETIRVDAVIDTQDCEGTLSCPVTPGQPVGCPIRRTPRTAISVAAICLEIGAGNLPKVCSRSGLFTSG